MPTAQQGQINDGEGAANAIRNELAQWTIRRGQIKMSQLTKFQAILSDENSICISILSQKLRIS